MEATDIVGSFRILIINCKMLFFLCLRIENPHTETAVIVGSFRSWIISYKTHFFFPVSESFRILIIICKKRFFWCLSAKNRNTETAHIVGSFGILILRKQPKLSPVSVFCLYRNCRHCRQFLYFDYQKSIFFGLQETII